MLAFFEVQFERTSEIVGVDGKGTIGIRGGIDDEAGKVIVVTGVVEVIMADEEVVKDALPLSPFKLLLTKLEEQFIFGVLTATTSDLEFPDEFGEEFIVLETVDEAPASLADIVDEFEDGPDPPTVKDALETSPVCLELNLSSKANSNRIIKIKAHIIFLLIINLVNNNNIFS